MRSKSGEARVLSRGSDPPPAPDIESSSDGYARRFEGEVGRYFLDRQWSLVREGLPENPSLRVLDLGGGHAQLAPPLIAQGHDVTVFGSAASSRARMDRLVGPEAYRFVAGSLMSLPFESASFDVVLAFRLTAHLSDWSGFIAEACRVARTRLIFDYAEKQSVAGLGSAFFGAKQAVEGDARRFEVIRRGEVELALRAVGYRIDRWSPQFALPMALHRQVGSELLSRAAEASAAALGITDRFGSPVVVHATRVPAEADS